jgi:hypothetical protein
MEGWLYSSWGFMWDSGGNFWLVRDRLCSLEGTYYNPRWYIRLGAVGRTPGRHGHFCSGFMRARLKERCSMRIERVKGLGSLIINSAYGVPFSRSHSDVIGNIIQYLVIR